MVWKPKEKELTLQEAVALAKRELAPFWVGSEPLVAAIRGTNQKVSVFPLSERFSEVPRLFIFVDPTQPSADFLHRFAREWHRRYSPHGCELLTILRMPYSSGVQSQDHRTLIRKAATGFPVMIDPEGLLAEALGARKLPSIALLHKGQVVFVEGDWHHPEVTELKLQNYLRQEDAGLPLRPAIPADRSIPSAVISIDLGRDSGQVFPAPGFQGNVQGFSTAQFTAAIPPGELARQPFWIHGAWIQDSDRIATSDPSAALAFHAPRGHAALVAQCIAKVGTTSKLIVELGDRPVFDVFGAEGLQADEDGNTRILVEGLQLYPLLKNLKDELRRVVLKFPAAQEFPVAIYGLRFWD